MTKIKTLPDAEFDVAVKNNIEKQNTKMLEEFGDMVKRFRETAGEKDNKWVDKLLKQFIKELTKVEKELEGVVYE